MTEVIRLDVRLQGYVRRQGRKWVAVCPSINVVSQGSDQADAQRCGHMGPQRRTGDADEQKGSAPQG